MTKRHVDTDKLWLQVIVVTYGHISWLQIMIKFLVRGTDTVIGTGTGIVIPTGTVKNTAMLKQ